MGEANLQKSNCRGPEDSEGAGAGGGVRKAGGVEFTGIAAWFTLFVKYFYSTSIWREGAVVRTIL
jgi:hypothetical protein